MQTTAHDIVLRRPRAALAAMLLASLSIASARPGEMFAVGPADAGAYSQALPALSADEMERFAQGRTEFASRWVVYPSGGGHWGRGPQSSAASCADCHPGNGRGRAPAGIDEAPLSLVLRLSVPGSDSVGGPRPHPVYGEQLNSRGVLGRLIEEGDFRVRYSRRTLHFADGESVELRAPQPLITALWYGPLGADAVMSLRLARPVFGAGLLEQVPESAMREIAARQHGRGIHGRINRVWNLERSGMATGRFGHKASQPTLLQQTAAAFITDIGVNSRLFPLEDCWPAQRLCHAIETVSGFEARDDQVEAIADYLRLLAPPAQRHAQDPQVLRGEALFAQVQCGECHVAVLPLGDGRRIRPYSDLLLHDMGAELADGRSEFGAGPSDWRTPPLWGLGLSAAVNGNAALLHDGRARTPQEAILWHGGEAAESRRLFMAMPRADRAALLRFLDSL